MTKRIVLVLEDPSTSTSEHYLDLLYEELQSVLADKGLQLIDIKKGDPEESPKS